MQITVKKSSLFNAFVVITFTLLAFVLSSLTMYLTFTVTYWAGSWVSSTVAFSVWIFSFALCSKGLWHLTLKLSSEAHRRYSK